MLSCVQLFVTPWTAAHQASQSITNSQVYPNSCLSSRWCHPTISSSVVPFSSCPQSFPASGSFPVSQFFTSGVQSIGVSASASVLPVTIQGWFPLGWTGWISLQSKGLSRVFSNTTVQKHQFFDTELSLYSISHIHTWLLGKPYSPSEVLFVLMRVKFSADCLPLQCSSGAEIVAKVFQGFWRYWTLYLAHCILNILITWLSLRCRKKKKSCVCNQVILSPEK